MYIPLAFVRLVLILIVAIMFYRTGWFENDNSGGGKHDGGGTRGLATYAALFILFAIAGFIEFTVGCELRTKLKEQGGNVATVRTD